MMRMMSVEASGAALARYLDDDEDGVDVECHAKGVGECVSLWAVSTVYDEGQANEDEFEGGENCENEGGGEGRPSK